jgi:hypothetical protein
LNGRLYMAPTGFCVFAARSSPPFCSWAIQWKGTVKSNNKTKVKTTRFFDIKTYSSIVDY